MRGIFVQPLTVPAAAIDTNGHVSNLEYLKWMQEVAMGHSAACGWPAERYAREGATWVIRSHFIEYLRPAFAGESLSLLTRLAALNPRSSPRRYLFWRERDRKIIAKAETLFVYVQAATGRPARIPDELKNAFDVIIADDADVLRTLGGDPPGPVAGV